MKRKANKNAGFRNRGESETMMRKSRNGIGDFSSASRRKAGIGRGNGRLDGRSRAGRAVKALESSLIAVLADPTPQQAILARLAARETVLLESLDAELLRSPGGSGARRRAYLALLADRQRLAASLTRHLGMIGLERPEPQITSLADLLEQTPDEWDENAQSSTTSQDSNEEESNEADDDPAGDAGRTDLR